MKNKPANVALRVCLIYAVIGGLWILLSGRLLFGLVSNPNIRMELEIFKGCAFIAVTAVSLYFLLRSQLRRMEGEVAVRRQAQDGLLEKTALLEAQLNSSIEGILVVDNQGRKIIQNQRAIDLWKIPQDIVDNNDDEKQVQFVRNQTKYPETFVEKVVYLYSHPNEISRDEVELKDGTILERYSSPVIGKDGKKYGRIWSFRDISERKRAEEALKQSEERLRQVMRSTRCILNYGQVVAPDGWRERVMRELTIFDWDFPVLNEEAAQEVFPLDVPPGKTYQQTWSEHRNPDDFNRMHQVTREAFLHNAPFYRNEFRCTDKHGVEHWMQEFITIHKLDENHWEIFGINTDITDLKKSDDALRESEAKFRSYVENAPLAVLVADEAGRLVDCNPAATELLGYDAAALLGISIKDLHSEADVESALRSFRSLAAEKHVEGEYRFKRRDGTLIWVSLRAVVTGSGLSIAFCQDITERKQSEESHQRLSTAVEQAAEAVVITDTKGNILYVNPAFEATTGYAKAEAIGRNPRFLKSSQHDESFYRKMWAVLANGEVWSGRLINKKKDGTLFEEEATISPVRDSNGRITNYVAVKRDITREVTLENQFRQSQKMEAFGQLAGGVAHDFNNLLTVIQGSASLLLNPQLNPEERASCSRQIVQAAERAAGLTRQLLMFSRKHALQVNTINLNEVVGNMTKMLQRILGEDIVLHAEYDPKIAAVSADAGMMEQVLLNLAVNSRDAMPKGGQLLIATSQEKLVANHPRLPADMPPGTYVCLKVTDTGCGIAQEVLPHIFEPFFTTKETGKGTGLGLATVYGIVQQHHGWVTVTSQPGQGATFQVFLPASADAPVNSGAATFLKLPRGTETILLTEDEPAVRVLASNILRRCGYTILPAESGVAALEVWHEYRDKIQLLLTDVIMPDGMTGYDLAQQLKSERPQLKVIYTSGYTGDVLSKYPALTREQCFLQKPYQPYQLARTVRECLDGETYGSLEPSEVKSGNGS